MNKRLAVSIGVAERRKSMSEAQAIVDAADRAMLGAKRHSRSRIVLAAEGAA
jgi:PleD family two-component response regulator